jgi:hypothetical protein
MNPTHTGEVAAENPSRRCRAEEVVSALERGCFHIYRARTLDEALALLTRLEAGERDSSGEYPSGSLNALAEARVGELASRRRECARLSAARSSGLIRTAAKIAP